MAHLKKREEAIKLRKKGKSYSEIKQELGVSKSTLSSWLSMYPLSASRIRALRNNNKERIEKFRNTMREKREYRYNEVYRKVEKDLSKRSLDVFVAGLYLYWAEGTKTARYTTSLTNSDPDMVVFFVNWLVWCGIEKNQLRIKLHLYSDMNIQKETRFWKETLTATQTQFNKAYVKKSKQADRTYKGLFDHGTCTVSYHDRDFHEYVMAGIKFLRKNTSFDCG